MLPALVFAMLSPLSDRTKSFAAVSAVLAVALCNVVFGMDWVSERPAVRPAAAVTNVAEPPAAVSPPLQPAPPAPPAAGRPMTGNAPAPRRGAPAAKTVAPIHEPVPSIVNEPVPSIAVEEPRPLCDVAACAAAYRTFRASDCTYMPSLGVRSLCSKGTPPQ